MTETQAPALFHSGYATLVGRPNVGKSTLLNTLIGEKVSIVTPKPQTTRHRILGIDNGDGRQIVFVDTPGMHRARGRAINRAMNRAASGAVVDADVVIMVIEALRWTEEDQDVLTRCLAAGRPVIMAVNKVDLVKPKDKLLPFLAALAARGEFDDIVPVSAARGDNVEALRSAVVKRLPEGPAFFPSDASSDQDDRFRISEVVREKLMLRLHEEIPYGLAVEVEQLEMFPTLVRAGVVIWVERPGQKGVVIGKSGAQLKACGQAARHELEETYGRKVHLELWVKVRKKWSDSDQALRDLGIDVE